MKSCQPESNTQLTNPPSIQLDPPQIVQTSPKTTASIHLTIPREEMPNAMGPAIGELMSTIGAQGISPVGPVFTHHLRFEPGIFDFEVSVPVSAPVEAAGRVKPSEWPAMKVARTVYTGPYEGLPMAWGQFMEWVESNGHMPAEDVWEVYVDGPHSSPDPSTWRTELSRPIKN